jgi:leader peptidase (prepilin peptidase) / N-methyltransferase
VTGSFVSVVIHRLPKILEDVDHQEHPSPFYAVIQGLSFPASHCPHCQHRLGIVALIPLLGWLGLRGHCQHCQQPVSWGYPLLELICAGLALLAVWIAPDWIAALTWFVLFVFLLVISGIDYQHKLIYNELSLPLLWLGLIVNSLYPLTPLHQAVMGAVMGYLVLWLVFQLYYLVRRREGLGYGDFKLLAAIGAWLGWQALPMVVFIASMSGIGYFVLLWLQKRVAINEAMPFGPFLALGAVGYVVLLKLYPPF